MTTEATNEKITIPMSERRPLRVLKSEWPIIASAKDWDNEHECQANRTWIVKVRQHADGRTAVYAHHSSAFRGERSSEGGLLLDAEAATGPELIRAIRRVCGMIGRDDMAQSVISDLPPEDV